MLRSLQVTNYVLIDSLEISFPAGLCIITGQTGAGKSILLGALSLLLGSKSDAGMVGGAGDNCVVEAEFSIPGDEAAREILEAAGLEWNDGELTIRRVLSRSGRSRCFIGDEPVAVGVLSALAPRLLDIHSQHQTLLLTDRGFQLSMLDHFAGLEGRVAEIRAAFRRLGALRTELEEVAARIRQAALEQDYLQSRYERLAAAQLRDGELEELEDEQRQLAHAEEIKAGLFTVVQALAPEEGPSLDAALKEAVRSLQKTGRFVPAAAALSDRMESARLEMEDILSEVAALEEKTDVSPDRLAWIDERLSLLYDLMKKHGCATLGELMAERDSLAGRLSDSSALEDRRKELEKAVAAASAEVDGLAEALHKARQEAAGPFGEAVQSLVRSLELERAVFCVSLEEIPQGATGRDAVRFLFSAGGTAPVDLARCASGGELSRIMLSLKAMLSRYAQMPAMVFDEIDTGVSGSVADAMGSMICTMGARTQVFAITHLPQVAAKGDAHYLVTKEITPAGQAVSRIARLSGEDRVREIARMLSGATITPEAIANARTLLG